MAFRLVRAYDRLLQTSPYRVNAATSLCISCAGDCMVQWCTTMNAETGLDLHRVARQGAWSTSLSPISYNWFQFISRLRPFGPLPAPVVGAGVDQIFFSPPVHALYFAWISWASSGFTRSPTDVNKDVRERLLPAICAGWTVWPAAVALSIAIVPQHYRVLITNCIGLGYGMLMSYMANEESKARFPSLSSWVPSASRLVRRESGLVRA